MRKNNGAGKNKHQTDAIDEVEELLKLTQDDLLLKLNVNSHLKSRSRSDFIPESSNTNSIHPDLDLRFQALRLKEPSNSNPNPKSEINGDHHEDIDNLFARFAALKGPSSNPTITTPNSSNYPIDDDDEDEDEVSKIINWAIDVARLDPSPSSDIDDVSYDEDDNDEDDDVSSDDDEGGVKQKADGEKKGLKK